MTTKTAVVILDDASGNVTYGDKSWTLSLLPQWYQGTSYWAEWTKDGDFTATMSVTFEGLAIGCIGNTPSRGMSQKATVTVDGNDSYNISYGDPSPQTYMQWYQSPDLLEGSHTILFQELAAISLDIVLVTVGPNTSLEGKTLFIDNEDPQIQYTGTWINNGDLILPGYLPKAFPVHNSTHQSSTPGDTLTFQFSGTSVSVYGVFDWERLGGLSATYNLDGMNFTKNYPVTATSPGQLGNWKGASNFLLFSRNLEAGPHILTITITEADNIAYALDYITYTPSFSNLASRPDVSSLVIGQPTTSGSSFPTQTIYVNGDSHTTSPVGAIVGGVLGAVALLVLVCAFLWHKNILKKREKKMMALQMPKPYADEAASMNDGYRDADIQPCGDSVTPYLLRPPTHDASKPSLSYGHFRQERRYSEMRQFSDMSSIHPSHSASQVRYAPALSSGSGETTHEAIAPYVLEVSPPRKHSLLP